MNDDERHLQLLSIFHYVVAGILGLIGLVPIIHLTIGILIVTGRLGGGSGGGTGAGFLFIGIALFMMTMAWSMAILLLIAGRRLAARRSHLFCLIVAGIACLFMPFGTVLGVFTIIVLMRPTVKAMFGVPA